MTDALNKCKKTSILLCLLFIAGNSQATHIKGGFIEIIKTRDKTVTFRLTGWGDTGSSITIGNGTFSFSDGTELKGPFSSMLLSIGNQTELVIIEVEHAFPAIGTYTVGYSEQYRNEGIVNMIFSEGSHFYTETTLTLDPFFANQFPILDPAIILEAQMGKRFESAFTAFDAEGDLLTFHLSTPLKSINTPVDGYLFPANSIFYSDYSVGSSSGGAPGFELTKILGNLTWDSPGDTLGEYSVAIRMNEWRKSNSQWVLLSSTQIDFNLFVRSEGETNPSATFPWDLCQEEPPYTLSIHTNTEITLSVDLPFLELENGDPANTLNGVILYANTDYLLYPNASYSKSGFNLGNIYLVATSGAAKYNVLYTSDCEALAQYELVTSIQKEEKLKPVVYPNPSQGECWISDMRIQFVQILSVSGQKLIQCELDNSRKVSLPQSLGSGLYLIQLLDGNNSIIASERLLLHR